MNKIIAVLVLIFTVVGSVFSQGCASAPSGLVGWWPGEGNANDIAGGNNGVSASNVGYGAGRVGLGFALNDTNAYVRIPASGSLNVGAGKPVAVTVRLWLIPWVTVAVPADVMAGAWSTVSVKLWVAVAPMPLDAERLTA